jgi:hypothetical protein
VKRNKQQADEGRIGGTSMPHNFILDSMRKRGIPLTRENYLQKLSRAAVYCPFPNPTAHIGDVLA